MKMARIKTGTKFCVILSLLSICVWVLPFWFSFGIGISHIHDFFINQEIQKVPTFGESILSKERRESGLREMRKSNVTIVGVGKNIGSKLDSILHQVVEAIAYIMIIQAWHPCQFFVNGEDILQQS